MVKDHMTLIMILDTQPVSGIPLALPPVSQVGQMIE